MYIEIRDTDESNCLYGDLIQTQFDSGSRINIYDDRNIFGQELLLLAGATKIWQKVTSADSMATGP